MIPKYTGKLIAAALGALAMIQAQATDPSTLKLPTGQVTYTAFGGPDYTAYLNLSGIPAGLDITNGVHGAWCIDYNNENLYDNHVYTGLLFNSLSSDLPANLEVGNFNLINYILNHKQGDRNDVNGAIWYFSDDVTEAITPTAQVLINDALANGQGFVPDPGQKTGVILAGTDEYGTPAQVLVIEVPTPETPENPKPSECDDFVTGGGWIIGPGGAKCNFGVQGGIKQNGLWGGLNYIDHATGMHIKSRNVTGYFHLGDPKDVGRQINYDITVNGTPATAVVKVYDNGEPGRNDTFEITTSTGYHAAGDLGGARPGGGNIQLHKSKCEKGKPAKDPKKK